MEWAVPEALPDTGLPPGAVTELVDAASAEDMPWRRGRGWALVYDLPGAHAALVGQVAARFGNENGLSHSAFPSAARFESAVIAMVASVVSPGCPAYGVFTSGGSESILQAVKAARDRPGAEGDTIVVPRTAHPAFGKAAHYLGLRRVDVPVGDSGAVDPADVAAALDRRTLLVAASAPNFPFGTVDPIAELGALATDRGVGLHVDAALGGLFLPFLDAAGGSPPGFGVQVPGVTSVSVDLHKYGYGAKGASVLLFADPALRHASYYVDAGWPGGAYAAAGVLGTRPVGPAAAAYASLLALGRDGFRSQVRRVMTTARTIQAALTEELPFRLLGRPAMSVFAAAGPDRLVAATAAGLSRRGWWVDVLNRQPALHFIVFPRHDQVVGEFASDLRAAAGEPGDARETPRPSAYGVMVRTSDGTGDPESALRAHLDARFDRWEGHER